MDSIQNKPMTTSIPRFLIEALCPLQALGLDQPWNDTNG